MRASEERAQSTIKTSEIFHQSLKGMIVSFKFAIRLAVSDSIVVHIRNRCFVACSELYDHYLNCKSIDASARVPSDSIRCVSVCVCVSEWLTAARIHDMLNESFCLSSVAAGNSRSPHCARQSSSASRHCLEIRVSGHLVAATFPDVRRLRRSPSTTQSRAHLHRRRERSERAVLEQARERARHKELCENSQRTNETRASE